MKIFLILPLSFVFFSLNGQERSNPVIEEYGGIYEIPNATVDVDTESQYKIVVDVFSSSESPKEVNPALYNVARMLNLHGISGVPPENLTIVLAIHGGATYAIMDNISYSAKYGIDNPNTGLLDALDNAGVRLTVCGQSLVGRKVDHQSIHPDIEIATSMLTTVTTHQLQGYTLLRF